MYDAYQGSPTALSQKFRECMAKCSEIPQPESELTQPAGEISLRVMIAPPRVLVATWGGGLFAVRSGAASREIPAGQVTGLAPDGSGGALAIVGGKSLSRRSAEGRWTTLGTSSFGLSCCTALGDVVFVGTDDARVLRLEPNSELSPLAAFDDVAGRETWYAGAMLVDGRVLGPPLGVRSMCATSDYSTLLVNVHVGGIPRSTDRGETWKPTIDIECDVHEVCAHPARPELVAAATAVGLAVSRDGGETWTTEHEGLRAPHCSAVAFAGDDILISASTDPFTKDGAIYRRPIDGSGRSGASKAGCRNGSTERSIPATLPRAATASPWPTAAATCTSPTIAERLGRRSPKGSRSRPECSSAELGRRRGPARRH